MNALILFSVASIIVLIWFGVRIHASKKLVATQKKRLEELIQIQKDNQVLINEIKAENKQLRSVLAHDLRAPFNRIFALTQLLQSSLGDLQNKDQQDYLAKMHRVIADGLGMIRNLMDNQKLESNGIDINLETFNLSSVLGTLARNYKVIAEKKNIQLQLEIVPSMIVHSDKYYLQRILDNLLSNALKFSDENSNVFINAQDEGGWINIAVRDEGPGISEEDQSKLFKKFQTLSAKPTGGETATGVGLSVAKKLAEKMNAELSYVSKLDQGTVFTLKVRKEILYEEKLSLV